MLFTLIAERYERRSLGITSNLAFSQWEHIFAQPYGHCGGHRPRGPSLGHPGIPRLQLSDRSRSAAGSGTGGDSARIMHRIPTKAVDDNHRWSAE